MRILKCQAVGWINSEQSSRLQEGFRIRLACFNIVPRDKHIEVAALKFPAAPVLPTMRGFLPWRLSDASRRMCRAVDHAAGIRNPSQKLPQAASKAHFRSVSQRGAVQRRL